jgi:cell wall-associated NlpC family hydrolase
MSLRVVLAFLIAAAVVVLPAQADAASKADGTGGTSYSSSTHGGTAAQAQASQGASVPTATTPASTSAPSSTTVPGTTAAPVPPATVNSDGTATAPAGAPATVVALIAAGNQIATTPYKYGGGHGSFTDKAYDCSGSVSFALHGAGLLAATLDSTELSTWGRSGAGRWITIYANKTHTYLVVAGIRFDTSGQKAAGGTRWQAALRSNKGFKVRHPAGF